LHGNVSKNLIVTRLKRLLEDKIIAYAGPTTDHTYKKVSPDTIQACRNEIGRSFCDAMLKITMKGIPIIAKSGRF
jgi:hypothetical protein